MDEKYDDNNEVKFIDCFWAYNGTYKKLFRDIKWSKKLNKRNDEVKLMGFEDFFKKFERKNENFNQNY